MLRNPCWGFLQSKLLAVIAYGEVIELELAS